MKGLKWALLATLALILLSTAGCLNKMYFFDFTSEPSLDREDGSWVERYEDDFELSEDGLELWNNMVSAPVGFKGDLELTVVFKLNVNVDASANLEILLAADIGDNDPCMGIDIFNMGLDSEFYSIFKYSVPLYGEISPIPVLHRGGTNEFKLTKTGNLLKFWLNGVTLMANVPIVDYGFDIFSPHIYCLQEEGSEAIFIRSVRVRYDGTAVAL